MANNKKKPKAFVYIYLRDAQTIKEYRGYSIIHEKQINGRTFAEKESTHTRIEVGRYPNEIFESSSNSAVVWLEERNYDKAVELFGDYIYSTIPYSIRTSAHFKDLVCLSSFNCSRKMPKYLGYFHL